MVKIIYGPGHDCTFEMIECYRAVVPKLFLLVPPCRNIDTLQTLSWIKGYY